ncbi:class II aldolase and adducin N-terminal domain-containing protein [Helicobacter sp. MIT 14-3879]|uniref:class II aldolase and adducin N-terminal domain-containing protein n=1 Tax=Helicobacter sp. MIT 14-3879 TaxID=2040649 RepID=UPI000E1E8FC1|nr:class II aldolase and adducin N-terminal domain-containing protein [Helicobacter sp. MIT 14-3879]RDU62443.1 hypothetical protein CQA44_06925 [Helicobacter sp. MIT 14-3879]
MIKNVDEKIIKELKNVSLAMFRKNFFDISHGAISHKINENKFIINTSNAIFDDISLKNLIILSHKRDYSYQEASADAVIHSNIYQEISEARCIAYTLPPFTTAYSINHFKIIPKDYYGYKKFREISIYDPKEFSSWEDRADVEICNFLKQNNTNVIVVKGFGIYVYGRDLFHLAQTIALIENSVKILTLHNLENTLFKYKLELMNNNLV